MLAEFVNLKEKDHILIYPETSEDLAALLTWDNSCITAKITETVTAQGKAPCLHICREY